MRTFSGRNGEEKKQNEKTRVQVKIEMIVRRRRQSVIRGQTFLFSSKKKIELKNKNDTPLNVHQPIIGLRKINMHNRRQN